MWYNLITLNYERNVKFMKKTLTAILSAATLTAMLAIPSFAADGEILKGTPVIDGKLDDIYKQSWIHKIDTTKLLDGKLADNCNGNAWALYDDKGIYVYVEVESGKNGKSSKTRDEMMKVNGGMPYNEIDAVEFKTEFTNGQFFFSYDDSIASSFQDKYTGRIESKAVILSDSKYAVEFFIAFVDGQKTGDEISVNLQIDNYDDEYVGAYGRVSQTLKLSATEAVRRETPPLPRPLTPVPPRSSRRFLPEPRSSSRERSTELQKTTLLSDSDGMTTAKIALGRENQSFSIFERKASWRHSRHRPSAF